MPYTYLGTPYTTPQGGVHCAWSGGINCVQGWIVPLRGGYINPCSDIPSRSSLRSSSNRDLVVPRTSRTIGDRAFSVAAPRAWNQLPTDLKLLRSTVSFKNKLKSFLFHAAYTENTVWTLECAISLIIGGALQVTVVTVTVQIPGRVVCCFMRAS